jgi:hypothetical protein
MRTTLLISALATACLASCTSDSQHSNWSSPGVGSSGPSNEQPSVIMSQDECDQRAKDSITAGNCDSEFDKLTKEIEADQTGGG